MLIKNMNNICSKIMVRYELEKLGLHVILIEFGEVEIEEDMTADQLKKFEETINLLGLDVVQTQNKKYTIVQEIKKIIKDTLKNEKFETNEINFSDIISAKFNRNYTYLSNIFTQLNGGTIEQFIIKTKIERAKEMLLLDENSISDIATKLKYCSVQHLSRQFKEVTGKTPSSFKQEKKYVSN